jgi:uncharacterized membrane protein
MKAKTFKLVRMGVAVFVGGIVSMAATQGSYLLAAAGVVTGMLFVRVAKSKAKIVVDERERILREKAANLAYAIFAPTIGIGSFLLLLPYQKLLPVFANGEFTYLESLGTILAYLTLFLISIYAISYHFLNRKYGGSDEE